MGLALTGPVLMGRTPYMVDPSWAVMSPAKMGPALMAPPGGAISISMDSHMINAPEKHLASS